VKLISWPLFHPEALDMRPLESNITERTQVLEVRTLIHLSRLYIVQAAFLSSSSHSHFSPICDLQTEQCIITAQSFVRRWLVRRRHRDERTKTPLSPSLT
jgi:hypothetical protein